jgi:hypothetical protein
MTRLARELNQIWEMEETKARQRSRDRNIEEGDMNTRYLYTVAKQRKRKTTIFIVEGSEATVATTADRKPLTTGGAYKAP